MKTLVAYLTESEFKESKDFNQFAMELMEADKKLAKYFDGATSVKVGASKSGIYITVYTKKGHKIDVTEALKNIAQKSQNYEYCASEVLYSAFLYPMGDEDKYEIIIELKSVSNDNFDYRKKGLGINNGKIVIEPSKL